MNLNFETKKEFTVFDSKEELIGKLRSATRKSRWYDLSPNLYGSIDDLGNFTFQPKFQFSLLYFLDTFPIGNAVLQGKIESTESGCTINCVAKTSLLTKVIIYLSLVIVTLILVDHFLAKRDMENLVAPCFILLLNTAWYYLIPYNCKRLLNRFEKILYF